MQSEIPQLQVITAISEAECEDFVSQLLFSQGWSIIYRALDMTSLIKNLEARNGALRTVVIYKSDLLDFSREKLDSLANSKVTHICLDNVETNSHKLMTYIRGQLRLPLIFESHNIEKSAANPISRNEPNPITLKPCIITVTGTVGAPGRSSIALNIANLLSFESEVDIYDADIRAPALEYLLGRSRKNSEKLSLVNIATQERTNQIKIGEQSRISIVDLGALPPLEEVVNDRRWQAGFINRTLEETTTLIYLCKSNGLSLIRLEQFMTQFPVLLRNLPIIYLLNQSGNSREDRALANRFSKMSDGERAFILPVNERVNSELVEPGKRQNPFSKAISEIGRIAQENM
jgi:hypothetical protein